MMMRVQFFIAVAIVCICVTAAPSVQAQGLLFYLPEDGQGVEYEGQIVQETLRSDLKEGKETITKAREMIIKSVGREDAEFDGTVQPCRWIEIKVVTGDAGAAGIDPGPVGSRIYKVLVPESKIIDKPVDAQAIPNIMIPIVKGYRRSGEAAVQRIKSRALGLYPTISQLMNYPEPTVVSETATPQTKATNLSFSARHLKGLMTMERPESRTSNEANLWVTPEVPFGLARWEVVVVREKKESTATRDQFKEISTTKTTMSVRRILPNAESELVTPE